MFRLHLNFRRREIGDGCILGGFGHTTDRMKERVIVSESLVR
jgi:hypothetical protein